MVIVIIRVTGIVIVLVHDNSNDNNNDYNNDNNMRKTPRARTHVVGSLVTVSIRKISNRGSRISDPRSLQNAL